MKDVLTLILGGGRGTRLYPLTKHRSEPAVPLAGKYRLIDVPISNCLNSGLDQIYVLTQFLSVSLHRHIAQTYKVDPFTQGFVEVLAAQQTNEAANWYQGTADALRQNLRYTIYHDARDVLVLSGDQIFRMDFRQLIEAHRQRQADVTLGVVPVPRERASDLGVLSLAADNVTVEGFQEKPQTEEDLARLRKPPKWLEARGIRPRGREYLANMGIYLFHRPALEKLMAAHPQANDLVHDFLIPNLARYRIQAFLVDSYWEDLGTIKSYFDTHLALLGDQPPFDFHSPEGVIFTRMRNLPNSRIRASRIQQCLIADGCVVEAGAQLETCVLGVRSRVGKDVQMKETILLGADQIETEAQRSENVLNGIPHVEVGEGSVISRAILDKDCRIGRGVQIINRNQMLNGEGDYHVIRDGIVVIPNGTVIPDGTVI